MEKETDDYIVEEAMKSLKVAYGNDIPEPEAHLISRWGMEPYILGSYTAPGHNQDDSKLRPELAKSIQERVFFCRRGNKCSGVCFYPWCFKHRPKRS